MHRCLLGILAAGLALAGCGDREFVPPPGKVVLTLDGPAADATVDDDAVEVSGRVQPADSTVLVDGDAVSVERGAFATSVELDAGTNVIDVQAAAPRRPAAMTAVRVTRPLRVPVPDVEGLRTDAAVDALAAAGLESEVEDISGILDTLFPGDFGACFTEPDAGDEVAVGTTVTLAVSPSCGDDD